jgi:hypothetical protein
MRLLRYLVQSCTKCLGFSSSYFTKQPVKGALVCVLVCYMRVRLTFRHRASCLLGQAFRYSPENAFYIFIQQIYFII